MVLYDFERDGEIPYGKTLIMFEDGSRELVNTKTLERRQDGQEFEPRSVIGSRPVRTIKHREEHTRQAAQRKGVPIRKAEPTKQSVY